MFHTGYTGSDFGTFEGAEEKKNMLVETHPYMRSCTLYILGSRSYKIVIKLTLYMFIFSRYLLEEENINKIK